MRNTTLPCDNFYEHVCGNYAESVPENVTYAYRVLHEIKIDFEPKIVPFLRAASVRKDAANVTRKALTYYDSCMDQKTIKNLAFSPIFHLIDRIGGWSLINKNQSFNEKTFQWEIVAGETLHVGVFSLLKTTVGILGDEHILQLETPELVMLDPSKYFNTSKIENYENDIRKILGDLGGDMKKREMNDSVRDILNFERDLAKMTLANNTIKNKFGKIYTYGDLKKTYNKINWPVLFNKTIRFSISELADDTRINVTNPAYFDQLNRAQIKPRTMYNYILWRYVKKYVKYTSEPTERQCLAMLRDFFALPIEAEIIRETLSKADVEHVEMLMSDLKGVMKDRLEKARWMDQETRQKAIEKLETMMMRLDYLDFMRNTTVIDEPYRQFSNSEYYFLDATRQLNRIRVSETWKQLKNPSDIDWNFQLPQTNAGHQSDRNKMFISPTLLSFPIYLRGQNVPAYVKFGLLGNIIGHEIMHAFDSRGSYHDKFGHVKNWWQTETRQKFNQKTQCFIDRNSNLIEPITGENYDGKLTLGETIADNGGIRIAWHGFQNEKNKTAWKLPGFEGYTDEEMFFITYANFFCESKPSSAYMKTLMTTPYIYGEYRPNIALQDFGTFSEVFKCQKGDFMFREEKERCELW